MSYRQVSECLLESPHQFDIIEEIYERTQDTLLLSYAMEAVLDTGFSLSYHDQVLHRLLPPLPVTDNRIKVTSRTRSNTVTRNSQQRIPHSTTIHFACTARKTFSVPI